MAKFGKVLYIGGYGRSGSTILSVVLAQLPGFYSVGELGALMRAIEENRVCTCGRKLESCKFWGKHFENCSKYIQISPAQLVEEALEFTFRETNAEFVVDSTKTSYKNFLRPWRLLRLGCDVYFVHLVRDLASVIDSSKKGANSALEAGVFDNRKFVQGRTHLSWLIANFFASCYKIILPSKYIHIRYESLISDPSLEITRLGNMLKVNVNAVIDMIDREETLVVGHEINGNRLLRSGPVIFKKKSD